MNGTRRIRSRTDAAMLRRRDCATTYFVNYIARPTLPIFYRPPTPPNSSSARQPAQPVDAARRRFEGISIDRTQAFIRTTTDGSSSSRSGSGDRSPCRGNTGPGSGSITTPRAWRRRTGRSMLLNAASTPTRGSTSWVRCDVCEMLLGAAAAIPAPISLSISSEPLNPHTDPILQPTRARQPRSRRRGSGAQEGSRCC